MAKKKKRWRRHAGPRPAKGKTRQEICVRRDCDGKCGLKHKRVKFAVEQPDPTGLEAANVRTTGRTTAKRARFVGGGLPGLGKR